MGEHGHRRRHVLSVEERGRDLFDALQRLDLEGIVAKQADPYAPGVTWYKIKSGTYTQNEGRWECSRSHNSTALLDRCGTAS